MCWPELLIERPKSFFLNPKVLPSICLEGRTQLPEDVLDAFDWALIPPPQKKITKQKNLESVPYLWSKIASFFRTKNYLILR